MEVFFEIFFRRERKSLQGLARPAVFLFLGGGRRKNPPPPTHRHKTGQRTFLMTLMGPATAPPALSSAALFTALAARARSSDASLAGEAGVFTFWAAAAGADAFLAGAAAFLAGAEADLGTAAFLDGEAAATALATPAAAAVRLEAGRDDDLEGVAFFDGVAAFFEGVAAFFAGDWREGERKRARKGRTERGSERGGERGERVREERKKKEGAAARRVHRSTKEERRKKSELTTEDFGNEFRAEEGNEIGPLLSRHAEHVD